MRVFGARFMFLFVIITIASCKQKQDPGNTNHIERKLNSLPVKRKVQEHLPCTTLKLNMVLT